MKFESGSAYPYYQGTKRESSDLSALLSLETGDLDVLKHEKEKIKKAFAANDKMTLSRMVGPLLKRANTNADVYRILRKIALFLSRDVETTGRALALARQLAFLPTRDNSGRKANRRKIKRSQSADRRKSVRTKLIPEPIQKILKSVQEKSDQDKKREKIERRKAAALSLVIDLVEKRIAQGFGAKQALLGAHQVARATEEGSIANDWAVCAIMMLSPVVAEAGAYKTAKRAFLTANECVTEKYKKKLGLPLLPRRKPRMRLAYPFFITQ
jgi:hypothetical protein